ncbi:MAG: glutathione S-transferase C-terminal domain-containing protein [Pseudomonadota bacterium]
MGQLVNGIWQDDDVRPTDQQGAYVRASSVFRHWVTDDGTAGPSGEGGFSASPGRYHLLVAPSCPWAHRAVIFRALKGLESIVSMSSADAPKTTGWSFNHAFDDFSAQDDGVFRLHQVYTAVDPTYTGKITVPTLWDRERKTIVNNESSEIIRMLNAAFQRVGANDDDYYPASHRPAIDEVNDFVYTHINNGVYRAGFAKTQPAYDEAVAQVFIGLDSLEARLGNQRYLAGDRITEADWRAFPTLLRFDLVYFSHFKCNLRRIQDYPNLANYTREL